MGTCFKKQSGHIFVQKLCCAVILLPPLVGLDSSNPKGWRLKLLTHQRCQPRARRGGSPVIPALWEAEAGGS